MNSAWVDFLGLFALLAVLGAVAILSIVLRELAPSGGLTGRERYLLAAGMGMGVLAFAAKASAVALMVAMPQATLMQLSGLREVSRPARKDNFAVTYPRRSDSMPKRRYAWAALPEVAPAPEDNPASPEKVALGERLFHDKLLSRDRSIACASCHDVHAGAGVDGRPTSRGISGQLGGRNAPTVWNAAFQTRLFLDGRAPSLEEQAKEPPVNPLEMGMHSLADVVARVATEPDYRVAFARVFGTERRIDIDMVVAAIAAYERTLITPDTPYDRFVRGDLQALDAAQQRGMALFESLGCVVCHVGPNFSSASVYDSGAPYRLFPAYANDYTRRYRLLEDTGRSPDGSRRGLWRAPSLRNVALTVPYFHNGAVDKLEQAVRIMITAQLGRRIQAEPRVEQLAYWSAAEQGWRHVARRAVTEDDVRDIAAFLRGLSGDRLQAVQVD